MGVFICQLLVPYNSTSIHTSRFQKQGFYMFQIYWIPIFGQGICNTSGKMCLPSPALVSSRVTACNANRNLFNCV